MSCLLRTKELQVKYVVLHQSTHLPLILMALCVSTFLASRLIRDKHMNFYTLPREEVRYKNTLPVGINFTKFLKFYLSGGKVYLYLTS